MKVLALSVLCLLIAVNEAKTFGRCELARILKQNGMDGYYGYSLGDWVCMAYQQSNYNSRAVSSASSGGSREYGIFQLSSRWWCDNRQSRTSNGCGISCFAFINDDITDDIECAKRVVRDPNRMDAWFGWARRCKGRDLSHYTSGCYL